VFHCHHCYYYQDYRHHRHQYTKKNINERAKYLLVSESGQDLQKAKEYWERYFHHTIEAQTARRAWERGINTMNSYQTMRHNEMLSEDFKTNEAIASSSAQSKVQAAGLKDSQVAEYRIRASRGLPLVTRIAIVELAIAGFGIMIALIALLNNEYISGLRTIDHHAIAILLGIGLGIGSLKEIIDK